MVTICFGLYHQAIIRSQDSFYELQCLASTSSIIYL